MALASREGVPPMRPSGSTSRRPRGVGRRRPVLLRAFRARRPVTELAARSRRVYLPAGATWTDPWTGRAIAGGTWADADAPLEHIPTYLARRRPSAAALSGRRNSEAVDVDDDLRGRNGAPRPAPPAVAGPR